MSSSNRVRARIRTCFEITPRAFRSEGAHAFNRKPSDLPGRDVIEHTERRGRVLGAAEAREELRNAVQSLDQALKALEARELTRVNHIAGDVLDLSVHIAEILVGKVVAEGRHDLGAILRDALRGANGLEQEQTLLLNPEDLELYETCSEEFRNKHWTVAADARLERGSCAIQTSFGRIERTIEHILGTVRERLLAPASAERALEDGR